MYKPIITNRNTILCRDPIDYFNNEHGFKVFKILSELDLNKFLNYKNAAKEYLK